MEPDVPNVTQLQSCVTDPAPATPPGKKPKRASPQGEATNDLVLSAIQGTNADLFPGILKLYVPEGAVVADTTYGQGIFWSKVPKGKYDVHATDLQTGTDARMLPYAEDFAAAVVFDPPYMHATGGTAHAGHQAFADYYKLNAEPPSLAEPGEPEPKYHEAILALYRAAEREAMRITKPGGVYIVKCQDEVCAGRQCLTHVELVNYYTSQGWIVEDLFVLLRLQRPGVSRQLRQLHSRKNLSYFVVVRKPRWRATGASDRTVLRAASTSPTPPDLR